MKECKNKDCPIYKSGMYPSKSCVDCKANVKVKIDLPDGFDKIFGFKE